MLLYLSFISGLLLFYFTGHTLYHVSNIQVPLLYQRFFAKTGIGLLVLVLIYSLIIAKGVTINIVILSILFFIGNSGESKFRFTRFKISSTFSEDKKAIFPILLVTTLIFSYAYWFIMVTKNGQPYIVNGDDLFNAQAAMYFKYTGIETLNWNYLDTSANSVSPYHYFICWIISFLSTVFNQSTYIAVELFVNPLLYSLIIIGLWAFLEKYKITPFRQVFCILILFICGLHISFMDHFGLFNWCYFYSNLFFTADTKLSLIYVVLLGCLLLGQNQKFKTALFVFLLLPVFSIALAPAVLLTCIVFLLVYSISTDIKTLKLMVCPVLIGLLIIGFYQVFAKAQMLSISTVSINLKASLLFSVKTYIYKCLAVLTVYAPYLIAILLLTFVNLKENLKITLQVFCMIIFSFTVSFIVWMLQYNYFGASEFHYYFIEPILNISLFTLILFLSSGNNVKIRRLILITIVLPALIFSVFKSISINNELKENGQYDYSEIYLNAVQQEVKGNELLLVGVIHKDGTFQNTGNPFIEGRNDYLGCNLTKFSSLMSLNFSYLPTMGSGNDGRLNMAKFDPLSKFISQQKQKGLFTNLADSRISFMKENHMKYLIVKPGSAMMHEFDPYIVKQITDERSKENFIVLKF